MNLSAKQTIISQTIIINGIIAIGFGAALISYIKINLHVKKPLLNRAAFLFGGEKINRTF